MKAGSLRLPRCGTGARYGAIGLDQQAVFGRHARRLAQRFRLRKREHAAEAQVKSEIQRLPRFRRSAA